jgi:hypothetical protein
MIDRFQTISTNVFGLCVGASVTFILMLGRIDGAQDEERTRYEKFLNEYRASLQECREKLPVQATAAARTELDREYQQRFDLVFLGHCGKVECERQWYDAVQERQAAGAHFKETKQVSQSISTGPVGCVQPGDVPWILISGSAEMTCLPANPDVKVQTP